MGMNVNEKSLFRSNNAADRTQPIKQRRRLAGCWNPQAGSVYPSLYCVLISTWIGRLRHARFRQSRSIFCFL